MDATRHSWLNAGAKCLFVRKTELSQVDSTVETMMQIFIELDEEWYKETDDSLFRTWNDGRTVRLPSRLAVQHYVAARAKLKSKSERKAWLDSEGNRLCGFIEFRGLPHAGVAQSKLRGFECSFMALIEADQMEHQDFMLSLACLRWKGADPETCDENGFILDTGVVLDTNPPGPDHWIAKLEEQEALKPEAEREMRFWHISTYENEHNLPPDYIKRQILLPYAHNQPMIDRMLWGRYADAFSGSPVFHAFHPVDHVGENLPWPIGAYLVRGFDFGTANDISFSAYWQVGGVEYWHVLSEQFLEGSDTDRQAQECVRKTNEEFPFWNDRSICAGIMDFCDPSGANSNFSTVATGSSVKILNTYGIYPGVHLLDRNVMWGCTLINRLLGKTDKEGQRCFRIDRIGAPRAFRAFAGGYRFPMEGEGGKPDEPLKGVAHQIHDYSHSVDPIRYSIVNTMRLAREEAERALPPNFMNRIKNPNRKLSYYE